MRFSIKVLVAVLCGVFLLCSLAVAGLLVLRTLPRFTNSRLVNADRADYREKWSFDVTQGDQLTVRVANVRLEISGCDGTAISASFEGTRIASDERDAERIEARQNAGEITFEQVSPARINFGWSVRNPLEGTLKIQVPRDQLGSIKTMNVSGEQVLQGLTAGEIDLDGASGTINVQDAHSLGQFNSRTISGEQILSGISSGSAQVQSTSGEMNIRDITASDLQARSISGGIEIVNASVTGLSKLGVTSGNIRIQGMTTDAVELNSISGEIRLEEVSANRVSTESTSGALSAELKAYQEIRCKSISGSVTLGLPADDGFSLNASTLSGSIDNRFASVGSSKNGREVQSTVGDGKHTITINTTSGGVRIEPLS